MQTLMMDTAPSRLPGDWTTLLRGIGGTPMIPIPVRLGRRRQTLHVKLESYNPFGSIKDRTAYSLIRSLETDQCCSDRLTVVESTSGNLGVALAGLCGIRGHSFIAVVDPKVAPENLSLMRRLGAKIEMVDEPDDTGNFLAARIRRARDICGRTADAYWSNQYENRANPTIHYLQTGPEIWQQTAPDLDAVFVAASTGGTLSGVSASLRKVSPLTSVLGVDMQGSAALGGTCGPRELTGIGASRRSRFVQTGDADRVCKVHEAEAIAICRKLADEADLRVGGSTGATVAACLRHLEDHPLAGHVVCISADSGQRYRSTLYDDRWIEEHGIAVEDAMDRLESRGVRFGLPEDEPAPPPVLGTKSTVPISEGLLN